MCEFPCWVQRNPKIDSNLNLGRKNGPQPLKSPLIIWSRIASRDFVIILKTAKVPGLTVPPTLLTLADEVIE
jgi:hypothetical protein